MKSWLHITAGRGPHECNWVVLQVLKELEREGEAEGLRVRLLDGQEDEETNTLRSALLSVQGEGVEAFLRGWCGTVQWIGKSPYRPNHRRKNWFVGVERLEEPTEIPWSAQELRVETMRSSGPGGQHANKVESAVRVTHIPTGLQASAQEERSQVQNRKLALARLAKLFAQQHEEAEKEASQERWTQHNQLVRGNPIRIYKGPRFKRGEA